MVQRDIPVEIFKTLFWWQPPWVRSLGGNKDIVPMMDMVAEMGGKEFIWFANGGGDMMEMVCSLKANSMR